MQTCGLAIISSGHCPLVPAVSPTGSMSPTDGDKQLPNLLPLLPYGWHFVKWNVISSHWRCNNDQFIDCDWGSGDTRRFTFLIEMKRFVGDTLRRHDVNIGERLMCSSTSWMLPHEAAPFALVTHSSILLHKIWCCDSQEILIIS